jgi:hypothetical protein
MASRGVQLDEVKAALAALQVEMHQAKEERKTAKSQLEKAILEEKPEYIQNNLKALLESASANLTRLGQEKVELLKRESQMNISEQGISS